VDECARNTQYLEESLTVKDEDILEVIENFKQEADHADPKVRKRLFQTLFREIKIHPKEGDPWGRILEITGVYIPLTRLKMASPKELAIHSPC
jgi:hypothetical protein